MCSDEWHNLLCALWLVVGGYHKLYINTNVSFHLQVVEVDTNGDGKIDYQEFIKYGIACVIVLRLYMY